MEVVSSIFATGFVLLLFRKHLEVFMNATTMMGPEKCRSNSRRGFSERLEVQPTRAAIGHLRRKLQRIHPLANSHKDIRPLRNESRKNEVSCSRRLFERIIQRQHPKLIRLLIGHFQPPSARSTGPRRPSCRQVACYGWQSTRLPAKPITQSYASQLPADRLKWEAARCLR